MVQEVARALAGRCAVVQVNTQENPQVPRRFTITGIPALVLLRRGRAVDIISGARDRNVIIDWFNRHH